VVTFAILALPATALAAKWTVATILVGEYSAMENRMRDTGSSDDVNVVVLHYKSQGTAVAYRLLKDTNAAHPKGQCCPNGETTCCDIESIPLSSIGISGDLSASAVKKFYQYIVQHFPADHYLLGLRGEPDTTRVLTGEWAQGITIVELNSALKTLVDARGGKKVELLVVGFCTSGALDWAYGVSPYVDYYVGTPQYTNPPVAERWRVYRWAREVIEKPTIASRALATRVVDLFVLTTTDCTTNSNGCSNAPKEPWTCVAIDEAKIPAVAAAVRDAVCAVLPSVTATVHKAVLSATTMYGSNFMPRYDMAGYFMNLKNKVTDAAAKAAIDRVLEAHDDSIVTWKYEPGSYSDKAYGYSMLIDDIGSVSEIGTWQIDSLWQAYMSKTKWGASPLPAATGMVVDPAEVSLGVSSQASLTARGVSSKFPIMCALSPVTWSTDALNGVATLDSATANPVVITGQQAGTGTLKASASGVSGQAKVTVVGSVVSPDAGGGHEEFPDSGTDPVKPGRDGGASPGRPDAGHRPSGGDDGGSNGRIDLSAYGSCGTTDASLVMWLAPLVVAVAARRRRSGRG